MNRRVTIYRTNSGEYGLGLLNSPQHWSQKP